MSNTKAWAEQIATRARVLAALSNVKFYLLNKYHGEGEIICELPRDLADYEGGKEGFVNDLNNAIKPVLENRKRELMLLLTGMSDGPGEPTADGLKL